MTRLVSLYSGSVKLEFNKVKHAYMWEGKFIPGVTSILKLLDKPALVQWAANMACEHVRNKLLVERKGEYVPSRELSDCLQEAKTAHRRLATSGANIGTQVHKLAERALVDKRVSMPTDPEVRKGAEAFMGWLHSAKPEPIDCERIVFSKHWYYAGTCDMYGRVDGKLCVLDFKTSSGLYLEMLLQIAAYAIALEEETGERIDDGWIIRLDKKTGKCQPYHIPILRRYRDAFLRVREAHELITKIGDEIDGLRKSAA